MSQLDVDSERGLVTLEQEARAAELLRGGTHCDYLRFPDKASPFDAVIACDGCLIAIVETKCRADMGADLFFGERRGLWLITYEKLRAGGAAADALGLPFYGFLYLVPDDLLLTQKIYEPRQSRWVNFKVQNSMTQRTVNGGRIERSNAYIDMRDAKRFHGSAAR